MKIAVFTPSKTEKSETFIQNHISNLSFEKVIIYGGSFPYLSHNYQPTIHQKRRFKFIQFIKNKLGYNRQKFEAFHLSKILKEEKVDVVFAEYLITGAETLEVCKKMNIPIIAIALGYDISMDHIITHYKDRYQNLFKYARNIVIVSEHMKVNLEALNCPEDKIVFSPAAPDKSFFNVLPVHTKKQILAVGRFVDKKAPHLTILAFYKALQKIPDVTLIMAGDGALLNVCKDLVKALKIENSVNFIGRITPEQHKELLSQSIIFVQHSKIADNGDSEGTPVAILEASAAGLPVISTVHAGIPYVVIHGKTGLLCSELDVNGMAENMILLLKNPERAKEMGRNGKQHTKKNFTLKKHIEVLEDLIKKAGQSL